MKLAIIDLDGVVANADARFAKAEEVKKATWEDRSVELGTKERTATDRYWRTVFDPALVELDTLIEGVTEAIDYLFDDMGYTVVLLTSRPESMREATSKWLWEVALLLPSVTRNLIMKAPAFQYTKTVTWKAGMVQTLEALYGAIDLLIIDDEQANINEHLRYFSNVQTRELCKSLAEAVAKLNGTWVEPDPFLPEE